MLFLKEKVRARHLLVFFIVIGGYSRSSKAKDYSCNPNKVEFKCPNGRCIPKRWECDKEDDCGDNSDEKHCKSCPEDKFRCGDGLCISKDWVCDGAKDCQDGSDEDHVKCASVTCTPDEFKCKSDSRKCIPAKWKCDHDHDCDDGSDEDNCAPQTCAETMFQCKNMKCIDKEWQCDRDNDCDDNSDEADCKHNPCKDWEFLCRDGLACIPKKAVCDNFYDCKDHSDEPANCSYTRKNTCPGKFDCKDGDCIKNSWVCDGDYDCSSHEDERNCSCPVGKIQCPDGKCIDKTRKCDKNPDCSDGSDEINCASKPLKCGESQFKCKESRQCINESQVCNGHPDCGDGSDESSQCGKNECERDNGGCADYCIDLKIGHRCTCKKGYELREDRKTCKDINECNELGKCSQVCRNKEGEYKCSCKAGYRLDGKDQTSCKAIERNPYIVFSDRHSIRKLTLHKSKFLGLVPNLPGSIAVDYLLAEKLMYWTDVNNETIQRTVLSDKRDEKVKVETIFSEIRAADGIAVDWVTRKLYWTESWFKRIEVSELDGRNRRTLINSDLDMPRAIVLYPAIGEMFWTDWGEEAKIEKCGMDGDPSSRKAIITEDILWPNALTLDYTIDRIWWADAKRHVIEHCDLNGQNRKVILTQDNVFHPFSISLFEDHVYWTDWYKTSIYKANKFTGQNVTQLKQGLLHPMGISVIHPQRQPPAFNFCQKYNGGCSHLCLLSAQRDKTRQYSCLCLKDVQLLPDNKTCNTPESLKCVEGMCKNGTCSPGNALRGPICSCHKGFTGVRCELTDLTATKEREQSTDDDIAVTIGISVGVVALIFVCGAIIGFAVYKRLQKRYSPSSLNFDNPVYTKTTESIESGAGKGNLIPFRFRKNPPQAPFSKDPEPVDL